MVDTHCHLQSQRFDVDRATVQVACLKALDWIVVIGDDIPSSEAALDLLGPRIYGVVGMHPYYAKDFDDATLECLRSMAATEKVVALGEMGLDYFNEYSPRDVQALAFRHQLDLACELNLPVVIHNREADEDCHAILSEYADRLAGCIMHCFGSGPEYARKFLDLGFYISFAGNVTFKKAIQLQEAAKVVPLERLLVETDAPYLAPVPMRGKRCEPHYVAHTAAFLAELKGVDPAALEAQTTANAHQVYRIPKTA
ncbi:MAG: TatD family hydrolase [Candidatus Hydrogenedentes bacterium]|nr:TatD family hydrolase [Candidatus Hydrogenedentota bacterium]